MYNDIFKTIGYRFVTKYATSPDKINGIAQDPRKYNALKADIVKEALMEMRTYGF